jgi:hypothetical protein
VDTINRNELVDFGYGIFLRGEGMFILLSLIYIAQSAEFFMNLRRIANPSKPGNIVYPGFTFKLIF